MALSGLVSFLCKSLFISQSTVNNRGSVASDLVLAKLLSKDNFFAVNSFPILSLGSFEDEALVTVYRDDPVAGATLISHFDVSFTNKVSLSLSGSSNSFNLLEFSFSQPVSTSKASVNRSVPASKNGTNNIEEATINSEKTSTNYGEATIPVKKSKRTKAQAKALPVIHPRDVDFGHLWRQLVRVGWTSKRPTQLSNSWSYSSPNARKDPHVEGVNMFIEPEESAVPEESVEPESVTASQIDKTVALSAKTVEDLFGPESEESEDDGERTQHIEGPNPENEHGTTCVAAAGDSASPSNSGQSDAAAEPATPLIPDVNDVLLPLHLNTEDVNVMKDGENADDYESFGSEADGSGSSDDERIERRQTGDEVLAGEEEISLMDTAFIDCLDGSLSIEDMDQNTLHSMAWSPVSSEFEPDAHAFPGMSDQVARPSADIRANKDSPVELLFYFMPTYPWRHITRETNRYKKVHVDEKAP
ncbi:hypothetical protein JG687_00016540 [Phytophthora cactorum]|uniref:Uncharacterized protein n=1 Tax=Phytophthora cactorum TaxID=29920 RepID=A0A8T1TQG0_9STRA|nr:hypothetical protein JG687_00016540 [Phytophthora cactorum]